MKRFFLILFVPLLMSSCASTFFYSTISSVSSDLFQTEEGDFISDSDSLLVAYWFNGQDLPIFINIYNKSQAPLYVDWGRSSVIVGGHATPYKGRMASVSDIDGYQTTVGSVSFIPPMSRKTFSSYILSGFNYDKLKDVYFKNSSFPKKSGLPADVKLLEFSQKTTPLSFKSYLSFFTHNYNNILPVEHEFYVSSLIKTKNISPSSMPVDVIARGDLFYIEKESKNKGFGQAVLGTTLLVGVVAAEVLLSSDEEY